MKLDILYEDNHLIAVNKTGHDLVQGDDTGDEPLSDKVKAYIKKKYNKPGEVYLGVAHRLDRPVTGVVLFARTSKALTRLNKMFQDKEVKKTYWAIVQNLPEEDEATLKHFMLKDSKKNKSYAFPKMRSGAKEAILHYKMISSSAKYHLLEVNLETGRHHQIRAQLAKIECPIRGDLKYGYPRSNKNGGISLHARKIEFVHPVTKENIKITAPVHSDDNLWKEFGNVT
ncbi:RluA family pseudouridine synthase [Alkalitalea saponilacus]|uniref:23S rRNA pseudouridine1911/1915/1917 synthase n=1 Tax=Alkalitalea saponilacus TaxID=889453 RepID=A0A1T5HSU3_9BACT|nr:RluA family pseudouridine synthase [Alkalitalea saponilacus]ASB48355.1 RNA pseudouridine synthase [Alkalitalea saponilacus]SKC23580.1 23S rRNA pseudouridine1911/1915/1917 synthase [Alkalitalea saponilacus]